jgi:cytochrome P450
MVHAVAAHHTKYGPVVRIAPNELSYISEEAWSDIYGGKPGRPQLKKDPGMALPDPETGVHGLLTTPSDEHHARMRKNFDPAFSDKALREQESLMTPYFDTLVTKLRKVAEKGEETDMVRWFNFCTFDIMGDLTFGFPFDTLNNEQDWIHIISFVVKELLLRSILMKYVRRVLPPLAPKIIINVSHYFHGLSKCSFPKN